MTAKMKRLLYLALGLLAGGVVWGLEELIFNMPLGFLGQIAFQGVILGAVFGYAFGAAEGIAISERSKAAITGSIGAGIGAAAGGIGTIAAAALMNAAANTMRVEHSTAVSILLPVSRIVAWGFVGALIGSAEGLRSVSIRRALTGALGGLAGGVLGGAGLEGVLRVLPNQSIGRAVGFLILGAGIGFFLGEFERRFSFARLRVLTGRLKNKEYILSRRRSRIGAGFASEIYLSTYKAIEPRHAEIVAGGGEMQIKTVQGRVEVNEKPVDGVRFLKYQDVIDLGSTRLLLLPL
jgi:hypothetical protein